MSNIIERLRFPSRDTGLNIERSEAADEIERLKSELETERRLSFRNQVAELEEDLAAAITDARYFEAKMKEAEAERDAAVKALTGWRDHYGWKDGEYIDNVNDIFKPIIDAARGDK